MPIAFTVTKVTPPVQVYRWCQSVAKQHKHNKQMDGVTKYYVSRISPISEH